MPEDITPEGIATEVVGAAFVDLLRRFGTFLRGKLSLPIRDGQIEPGAIHLRHRITSEAYFREALQSKEDVLLISIMSSHTLANVKAYLRNGMVNVRRLRVLTWDPDLPSQVINEFARHLGENAANCRNQVVEAWRGWKECEAKYGFVEVRRYRGVPTMQGVVWGRSAMIELLPYRTPTSERCALLLADKGTPNALRLFVGAFESMWDNSQRAPLLREAFAGGRAHAEALEALEKITTITSGSYDAAVDLKDTVDAASLATKFDDVRISIDELKSSAVPREQMDDLEAKIQQMAEDYKGLQAEVQDFVTRQEKTAGEVQDSTEFMKQRLDLMVWRNRIALSALIVTTLGLIIAALDKLGWIAYWNL